FGAFVDLEGIDGLIHISELSWSHVNHPSEVLSIGETVRVKVLDIDRDRQRISLGLKQTQEDPWQRVLNEHKEGDVVEGRVTKIVAFGAFVQILPGVEGLVHISELAEHHVETPGEVVQPGQETWVRILEIDEERRRIEGAAESGEPIEGIVIEVVKGGLILDLGVRGFLPASLVDIRRVHNLDEFKGETLECKVIELNRSRNNVVLSRRAVLEEERKEVREQILGRLEPGQVVEGKISNIVDFGAFVDLEGIDGLIHISELSWSHVNHPSEVVSIGDTVRVKVLDIDKDRQRISLGLKQTQEDPWQRVLNEHKEGDVVEGRVTKIVAFGAFVQILPGVEGLVHISELAQHHVESPAEVVRAGDELQVKILEVDDSRRRLSLSAKRVEGQELPVRELEEGAAAELPAEPSDAEPTDETAAPAAAEGAPEAEVAPPEPSPEAPPEEAPPEEPPETPPDETPQGASPQDAPEEAPAEEPKPED
ncbi:MAG: S1 RNA-binding domain-containing protein, partial [Solirubrobacterales bacterium]